MLVRMKREKYKSVVISAREEKVISRAQVKVGLFDNRTWRREQDTRSNWLTERLS